MDIFGGNWVGYTDKIAANWTKNIKDDDLVLLPGDISWAMHLEEALVDLLWIDKLPGTKVLIRGNHDYWYSSPTKMERFLPPSIHMVHNNAFHYNGVGVAGTRLWDSYEYSFSDCIEYTAPLPLAGTPVKPTAEEKEKIFLRELGRLELSLKCLLPSDRLRIAMTHYPPIGPHFEPTRTTALLEKYKVDCCIFGHVHNLLPGISLSGSLNGIKYYFAACDFLNCSPLKISDECY